MTTTSTIVKDKSILMTAEELTIWEWQYGYTGTFGKTLMETICRADEFNLELLRLGFPHVVKSYLLFKNKSGWWEAVQEKAIKLGWTEHADQRKIAIK